MAHVCKHEEAPGREDSARSATAKADNFADLSARAGPKRTSIWGRGGLFVLRRRRPREGLPDRNPVERLAPAWFMARRGDREASLHDAAHSSGLLVVKREGSEV